MSFVGRPVVVVHDAHASALRLHADPKQEVVHTAVVLNVAVP